MATLVRELRNGRLHSDIIDTDGDFGIRSILARLDRLFVVAFITMFLFIVFLGGFCYFILCFNNVQHFGQLRLCGGFKCVCVVSPCLCSRYSASYGAKLGAVPV